MKSSYKIALLLAAGLLVFVLGYYATQEPEGGGDERVATGPALAGAADAPGDRAPAATPRTPDPAPDASRPAVRPAPEPKSGDRFFEDLKRSLQATQNSTTAPGTPGTPGTPGDAGVAGAAPSDTAPATTPPPASGEPTTTEPTPGAAAARANGGLGLPGTPSPTPTPAPGTGAANVETASETPAAPATPARPAPALARPTNTSGPATTPPSDNRPFFGPGPASAPAPAAAPTRAAEPAPPATTARARTYTIRPGDTFESIAQRELGAGRRWVDIAQANPLVDPTRLQVGQEIRLPGAGASASAAPARDAAERGAAPAGDAASGGGGITYTVRAGDTLSGIAQQYYGSPNDWRRIFDANRRILRRETDLRPGQELTIPPGGRRAQ